MKKYNRKNFACRDSAGRSFYFTNEKRYPQRGEYYLSRCRTYPVLAHDGFVHMRTVRPSADFQILRKG